MNVTFITKRHVAAFAFGHSAHPCRAGGRIPSRQAGASLPAGVLDFVVQRKLTLWHKVLGKELDMNEEAGTTSAPGSGEAAGLDAQGAAVIMQQARERAGSELRVRRPMLFVTWGLVLLIGYGAMWLSVLGQQPFRGPAWPTLLLAFLLLLAALIITAQIVDWAASGVGGRSEVQRGIFALALAAGYAALLIEKIAVAGAGVSRPVQAVLGAAAPMLAAGLVFVATSAVAARLNWTRLALGLWLLAVAAGGAWGGPVTTFAVCALAGGGGVLLMAVVEPRLRRS